MVFEKLLVGVALIMYGITVQSAELLPEGVKHAPSDARWHGNHDFRPEIGEAQRLLLQRVAGFKTADKKLKFYNVLLAVKGGRGVELVSITEEGANLKGFRIDWTRRNGINTPFMVKEPEGYVVLAARRAVRNGSGYREAVYTPFTTDIDTPVMREAGLEYLQTVLASAYDELGKKNVRSRARPGRPIQEVVPTDVALVLLIIEHIDPDRLRAEKIEWLMNEVLVTIAANRTHAYRYSGSPKGARGLAQFMPRTYAKMVRTYPRAKLKHDFVAGMNDHVNAAQATLLLFDSDLSHLPPETRTALFRERNKKDLARYLAAAYNGGAGKAMSAYLTHDWGKVYPETRLYLRKLLLVSASLQMQW